MTVVPLDSQNLWVTANFKETQLKYMRPGQPASISIDAYGRTYQGRVLNIAGASGARYSLLPPENATGNYVKVVQRIPVRIVFDQGQDAEHLLGSGCPWSRTYEYGEPQDSLDTMHCQLPTSNSQITAVERL